jgi:nicotinate-nucleotide adenylyltransferase
LPAAQSPFKPESGLSPAKERLRLLRLALAGRSWCEIDEQELERGGVSYTIDTVRDYARRFAGAQIFYLIGADHAPLLPEWRQAEELAQLAQFAVIPRPGPVCWPAERPAAPVSADVPGTRAAETLLPPPFRGQVLAGFPLGVSSSMIRARVKAGLPVGHLVPAGVAEAIRNNRLYL